MNTVKVFDLDFNSVDDIDEAVELIFNPVVKDKRPIVMTPNVDQIIQLEEDPLLKDFLKDSFLIFADGMPIVWTSRTKPMPITRRMSGSDLFPVFWKRAQELNQKILFVAAAEVLGKRLCTEYQYASYYVPPFFDIETDEYESVVSHLLSKIEDEYPDFIVIGLSYPKREYLCKSLLESSTNKDLKYLLLGAAPEFYLGMKRRAPVWMQENGFEWLHRLLTEPRRLFKRYAVTIFKFFPILIKEVRDNNDNK